MKVKDGQIDFDSDEEMLAYYAQIDKTEPPIQCSAEGLKFVESDYVKEVMEQVDLPYIYPKNMMYRIKRLLGFMYLCSIDVSFLYWEALDDEFDFSLYDNQEFDGEPCCSGIVWLDGRWKIDGPLQDEPTVQGLESCLLNGCSVSYPYKDVEEEKLLTAATQLMSASLPDWYES